MDEVSRIRTWRFLIIFFFVCVCIMSVKLQEYHSLIIPQESTRKSTLENELDYDKTRTPTKQVPGVTDTVALAPLCGFFNHHDHIHNVSTFGFDTKTRRFVVRADRSYKPNEQVFIRYGRLDNANLIHHYSFVLPENKYENLKVSVSQMQVTPHHAAVSAMLKNGSSNCFKI